MRQILVPAILVSKGYDETMGESVVQLLGAGIPPPFEILDEWQSSAQIAEGPLDDLYLGLWGSVVELEQHDMPINTASLCHKNLLIFRLIYPFIYRMTNFIFLFLTDLIDWHAQRLALAAWGGRVDSPYKRNKPNAIGKANIGKSRS